jgi:hypothetical protein
VAHCQSSRRNLAFSNLLYTMDIVREESTIEYYEMYASLLSKPSLDDHLLVAWKNGF